MLPVSTVSRIPAMVAASAITTVPGWVSLCGNMAPMAAMVVFFAVSLQEVTCYYFLALADDDNVFFCKPFESTALSYHQPSHSRKICGFSPSFALFLHDCKLLFVAFLRGAQERIQNMGNKPDRAFLWLILFHEVRKICTPRITYTPWFCPTSRERLSGGNGNGF